MAENLADFKSILVISEIGCGPPYLGNRARMKSLLEELRAQGLEIHFADVAMSQEEREATRPYVDQWVATFCMAPVRRSRQSWIRNCFDQLWRLMDRVVHGRPSSNGIDRWFDPLWLKDVRVLQKQHRYPRVLVAYVFHSRFLDAFPKYCLKLIDTHDSFSGRKERLEGRGIKDFWFWTDEAGETKALLRSDVVIAIQEEEAQKFLRLTEGARVVRTVGHITETIAPRMVSDDAVHSIGFLGSDNPLNIDGLNWFLNSVWPSVQSTCPAAKLKIGGRICRTLAPMPGVQLLGEVSSASDLYDQCLFTINPMQEGTGLKIKTIESLAHGKLVVGTTVAAAGVDSVLSQFVYVADVADDFAKAVRERLEDSSQTLELGIEAVGAIEVVNNEHRRQLKLALGLV